MDVLSMIMALFFMLLAVWSQSQLAALQQPKSEAAPALEISSRSHAPSYVSSPALLSTATPTPCLFPCTHSPSYVSPVGPCVSTPRPCRRFARQPPWYDPPSGRVRRPSPHLAQGERPDVRSAVAPHALAPAGDLVVDELADVATSVGGGERPDAVLATEAKVPLVRVRRIWELVSAHAVAQARGVYIAGVSTAQLDAVQGDAVRSPGLDGGHRARCRSDRERKL